jgi:two-component system, chemotaxis family, sensor kinase CheA
MPAHRSVESRREDAVGESFDLESLIEEFRDEARDQVDELDAGLLRIERESQLEDEDRRALLRSLHTLKGNAGMLGLAAIRDFVHVVEAAVKAGPEGWPEGMAERLFEGATTLRRALEAVRRPGEADAFRELSAARRRLEGGGPADAARDVALAAPLEAPEGQATGDDRLRVPFAKLDALLNEVGELVGEAESLLDGVTSESRAVARERAEAVRRRSDRLQEMVMSLRLVPLGRVLGRFHGLVRRLAHEQGKEARLVLAGEDTEMDKSTADALAEPLLHLVRNAIDHGIERPEARESAGKARHGTLRITAEREGDQVRIEVEDDGRGLDLDAVRARARRAALVSDPASLSDEAAQELIFWPGLSTRADVDTVSGRGLGLDVVRRSIHQLRGELRVERRSGGGTRFTMRLPLAVAVVPSLVFEAAGETLAVPAMAVARTLPLGRVERVGVTEVVRDGDRLVPLVDPDRLFGWPAAPRGNFGVLLRWGRAGAVVSARRLLHQRDLVVKAMPPFGARPSGVSGASVLPGGKVILVLDPAEVIEMAGDRTEEVRS